MPETIIIERDYNINVPSSQTTESKNEPFPIWILILLGAIILLDEKK